MDDDAIRQKLRPEVVRASLIRAGLLLAAWEILKSAVDTRVRDFFAVGFDENEAPPNYVEKVLARGGGPFRASAAWLVEVGALTPSQEKRLLALRDYRNEVAHELPTLLIEPGRDVDEDRLQEMREFIGILGRFWARLDLDTDPYFDEQDVYDTELQPGILVLMDALVMLARDEGTTSSGVRRQADERQPTE